MFLDLSIANISYWFPVMVDEDLLSYRAHLPLPLPPITVQSPFSAKLITSVHIVMIIEMFTALPSGILGQNFLCCVLYSCLSLFPAIFVIEVASKLFLIFSIILSLPPSLCFSQSLFPEALPPGCSLSLLPWLQWLEPLFLGSQVYTWGAYPKKECMEGNFLDLTGMNVFGFFYPYFFFFWMVSKPFSLPFCHADL